MNASLITTKIPPIYFCSQCKKVIQTADEFFFVENGQGRGFCAEECTNLFYSSLVDFLDHLEQSLRSQNNMETDIVLLPEIYESSLAKALEYPEEIWSSNQSTAEKIYFFIHHFSISKENDDSYYFLLGVIISQEGQGYVLWESATQHEALVDYYRSEVKIGHHKDDKVYLDSMNPINSVTSLTPRKNEESKEAVKDAEGDHVIEDKGSKLMQPDYEEKIELAPEEIEKIDKKKRRYWIKFLELRSKKDIPIDSFVKFEGHIRNTLDFPDELYRDIGEENEVIFTYIKSFQVNNTSFFYLVLCLLYKHDQDIGEETLVPLLCFPSIDGELYSKYKKGEKVSGQLKS